jgi:hypothetical protein
MVLTVYPPAPPAITSLTRDYEKTIHIRFLPD